MKLLYLVGEFCMLSKQNTGVYSDVLFYVVLSLCHCILLNYYDSVHVHVFKASM